MSNKLQELTERLYSEGLSKGKEEGARILEEAGKQADEIVAKAKAEAEAIKAEAEKQAADLQSKVRSDLKMAAEQCLQATRKDIENILTGCICNEGVDKALGDTDFLKQIISAVAEKFSATESVDIALVMPEKLRKEGACLKDRKRHRGRIFQENRGRIYHRTKGRQLFRQSDRGHLPQTHFRVSASCNQKDPFRIAGTYGVQRQHLAEQQLCA